MWYCSADHWNGEKVEPVRNAVHGRNVSFYMQGRSMAIVLIDALKHRHGLGDMDEVILTGDCSGAVSPVIGYGDEIIARLPRVRKVRLVSSSGYFLQMPNRNPAWPDSVDSFQLDMDARMFHGRLNPFWATVSPLVRPELHPVSQWAANGVFASLSEFNYPLQKAPVFITNSAVDSCSLAATWSGVPEAMSIGPRGCLDRTSQSLAACTGPELARVGDFRDMTLRALSFSGRLRAGRDGGFIHTCLGHADGLRKDAAYRHTSIDGVSVRASRAPARSVPSLDLMCCHVGHSTHAIAGHSAGCPQKPATATFEVLSP